MASSSGDADHQLEKEFVGKVTNLHSTYGMVNHKTFFDLSTVVGNRPVVGSEVHVHAKRQHTGAGWVATRVFVVGDETQWRIGSSGLANEQRVIMGRVTHARGLTGTVDSVHHFQKAAVPEGYSPCNGDWLRCYLRGNSDHWTVERVEPVRKQQYQGCITSMRPRLINDDITFMMWSCVHAYRPQVGDAVEGEAIEHDGREACWRALDVRPAISSDAGSAQ